MNDLVSIIIPTYNRAYILPVAIESVIAQTYPHWELIVVDDGSTDDTRAVVEGYADPRIIYVHQENKRQSAARNNGLARAKGRWITFLDSDNEFLPPFLERALATFAVHPEVLCIIPKGHRTQEFYKDGVLIKSVEAPSNPPDAATNPAKALCMREFIFEPNAFIHAASIRDEGFRFDEDLHRMEDWDYAMSIAERHPDAFLYLPETLYNYHQRYGGDGVVSNSTYDDWADIFEAIYQRHKNDMLMAGQTWYPQRVEKWRAIAQEYRDGKIPPPHLYYFNK